MRAGLVLALIASAALAQPRVYERSCDVASRRSDRGGVDCLTAAAGPSFSLFYDFNFAQTPQTPNQSHPTGLVAWCHPKDSYDGGAVGECLDANGAQFAGYSDGTGTDVAGSFATYGGIGPKSFQDITDAKHPSVDNAAIRALFGGDYTICLAGFGSSTSGHIPIFYEVNTPSTGVPHDNYAEATGGAWLCDDATNGAGPGALTDDHGGIPLDGLGVACCSRTGGVLTAFFNSAANIGTLTAASSGTCTGCGPFSWGAGSFAGNATRGPDQWVGFWNVGMTGAEMEQQIAWPWWGAVGVRHNVGSVAQLIGKDNTVDSGQVDFFKPDTFITDPTWGIETEQGYTDYCTATLDPTSWTDVGTPTVTANAVSGPFSRYLNRSGGALFVDDDGAAFEGKRFATVTGLDGGGAHWYNASCFINPGTSGTTTDKARIRINTDGVLDAGALVCDVTLASGSGRYPATIGCPAFIVGAGSITADVLVGNATGTTGSIAVSQCQLTNTGEMERPDPDGTAAKGSGWIELDGGAMAIGDVKGKVCTIFSTIYSSSTMGADKTLAKGMGAYIFDAFSTAPGASHDVLAWTSVTGSPTADGGLGQSSFDSLVYGLSSTFENKFESFPQEFTAQQLYIACVYWVTESGVLPDAGTGIGCRATTLLDVCNDPTSCVATTVVSHNSGALGTCPAEVDSLICGSRGAPAGSAVTTTRVRNLRFYH